MSVDNATISAARLWIDCLLIGVGAERSSEESEALRAIGLRGGTMGPATPPRLDMAPGSRERPGALAPSASLAARLCERVRTGRQSKWGWGGTMA
mmetsp:Transcript_95947/g.311180  ORF Transcript_95947/g.311180 Transcript_95947/m.311180 type:complete len:95 (-) Transcript_95947:2-286(-)